MAQYVARNPQGPETIADNGITTSEIISTKGRHFIGRVPAFAGLARWNGGCYAENLTDGMTIENAMKSAKLDFTVAQGTTMGSVMLDAPVMTADGPSMGPFVATDDNHRSIMGIWPDGNVKIFGQGRARYQIIQPEVCALLGNAVLGLGHRLVAAGSYGTPVGSKMYLAFDAGTVTIGGHDKHDMFFHLLNSFDAHSGLRGTFAPIRFDCTNQTNITFGKLAQTATIRHSGNIDAKVDDLRQALRAMFSWTERFKDASELLLATPMVGNDLTAFAEKLFPTPTRIKSENGAKAWETRRAQFISLATDPVHEHNAFGRGTRYGAYNALTFLTDHYQWENPAHHNGALRRPTAMWERQLDGGQETRLKERGGQMLLAGLS